MAEKEPQMQATLGLTGLTMNAMALIAPGAFLWLTFFIQSTTGNTAPAMWAGIVLALLLCLATTVCYAEMASAVPVVTSPAAIASAVRAATGRPVNRLPIRPQAAVVTDR